MIPLTLYLIAILVSPLFFGGIHTYAYTFAFLLILVAGLLVLRTNVVREGGTLHVRWPDTAMNPLFILLLVFLIFQMIPLPDFLLTRLSPDAKVAGDMSMPAVSVLDPAFKGNWYALASYNYQVRMSLIRWIVYGVLFFGLVQTLNSRRRIEIAVVAILLLCCFETIYGIIQTYSGAGKILWFKYGGDSKSVNGTYLNRNHFAGLLEMGIILAIAYAGALSKKSGSIRKSPGREDSLKKRTVRYISEAKLLNKRFLVIYASVIMGLGLILSASRGGIISAAGALLLLGFLFSIKQDYRRKRLIISLFSVMTAVYALYVGIDYTVGRFYAFDTDIQFRLEVTNDALNMFDDYRLAGVGVGNYRHASARYGKSIDYAHNDWAQFMAEAGIAGLFLFIAGIAYYIHALLKKWFAGTDPFSVCLGIAPVAAMASIGIHSLSDFNLHRPANFMMLAAVTAIGYSALHLESRRERETMAYRFRSRPLRGGGAFVLALLLVAIVWSGVWSIRHFVAEAHCNTIPNPSMNLDKHPPADEILKAIAWDSGNAEYLYKLAWARMDVRNREMHAAYRDTSWWHEQRGSIIAALEEAIRLNPFRAEYHMRLAWEYSYQHNLPDYVDVWLPAADISMDRAAYFTGNGAENPHMQVDLGNYWTMRSKTLDPSDPKRDMAWTKAAWHYNRAIELRKSKPLVEKIGKYVKIYYPDGERLKDITGIR